MEFFEEPFDELEADEWLEEPFEEVIKLVRRPWAGAVEFFQELWLSLRRDPVARGAKIIHTRTADGTGLTIDLALLFFNRIQSMRGLLLYVSLGLWVLSSQSIGFASSGDFYEFLIRSPTGVLLISLFVVSGIFLELWKLARPSAKLRPSGIAKSRGRPG
jgi:hypothetical protein